MINRLNNIPTGTPGVSAASSTPKAKTTFHASPGDRDMFANLSTVILDNKEHFQKLYPIVDIYSKATNAIVNTASLSDCLHHASTMMQLMSVWDQPRHINRVALYTRLVGTYYSRLMGGSLYFGALIKCIGQGQVALETVTQKSLNQFADQQRSLVALLHELGYLKVVDITRGYVKIDEIAPDPYLGTFNKLVEGLRETPLSDMMDAAAIQAVEQEDHRDGLHTQLTQFMRLTFAPDTPILTPKFD
jgi:hypothetical protein